jgi:hypothetical protein
LVCNISPSQLRLIVPDNPRGLADFTDADFADLVQFRLANSRECFSPYSQASTSTLLSNTMAVHYKGRGAAEIKSSGSRGEETKTSGCCQPSYRLDERLFPVELNGLFRFFCMLTVPS